MLGNRIINCISEMEGKQMFGVDNLEGYDVIIAWGAGRDFERLYKGQFHIDYLVDSNPDKYGIELSGKTITEMSDDYVRGNSLFIISSSDYYKNIYEQIQEKYPRSDIVALKDLVVLYGSANNYYCLWGIDAIVNDILMRAGYNYPNITYIEIGANHPLYGSATMSMYMKKAEGVLVEANPEMIPSLKEMRPRDKVINCGIGEIDGSMRFYRLDNTFRSSFDPDSVRKNVEAGYNVVDEIQVPIKTLDDIFEDQPSGWSKQCYVSIATMGYEEKVLRGFDHLRWRPPIISVGYSSDAVLKEKIFSDYKIIAEVPKHKILVTPEIYKQIIG